MRVLLHKAGALESVALSLIIQKPASLLPGIYIKDGCQDTQYQVHSVVLDKRAWDKSWSKNHVRKSLV